GNIFHISGSSCNTKNILTILTMRSNNFVALNILACSEGLFVMSRITFHVPVPLKNAQNSKRLAIF
ncbi:MAG: hypothetical protein DRP96_12790, partial [Candidatus Neomarinimicrobiota bacterium]